MIALVMSAAGLGKCLDVAALQEAGASVERCLHVRGDDCADPNLLADGDLAAG
jgi:hypothetical protein